MSFMGGITDFLTGGANKQSEEALNQALQSYSNAKTPTIQDLTLPELEKYVQQGLLTPEQAQAALQKGNAYDNINVDPTARQASIDALTKLQEIGDAGGMDATERAKLGQIQSTENQTLGSQRASILDQMDQRGIPSSLMGVQAQLAAAGQDAEQAHQDALSANADASTRALQALEASGSLGNSIQSQQFSEQAQKSAAQNAIDQWNAANQTTVNMNNAAATNAAAASNLSNKQSIANTNTQNDNSRTAYNANVPQTVYQDQLQKANGEAGVHEAQAKQYTGVGEQNAGSAATLLNLAAPNPSANMSGISSMAPAKAPSPVTAAINSAAGSPATDAVMLASHGGVVPGHPAVPGDSPRNDTHPAMLSPGEMVIPASKTHDPQTALAFIKHLHRQTAQGAAHPDDVKSVLHALGSMRQGG